jgi:TonB family protein
MKAYRTGNEIFLSWNQYAAEVLQADNASLTIVDDGRKRKLQLSPNDLQTGSLRCPADGDDVRIELDVAGRTGDFVESLRVVGESPVIMAATAPTGAKAVPPTAGIKEQESIAPPPPPEARTATVAASEPKVVASEPKVAAVLPPVKAKQVAAQPMVSTVRAPDSGSSRALIAAPQIRDDRRVVAKVPSPKAAVVNPEPEKTPARQLVPGKITTATRVAPKVGVQPPPKSASRSVVNVLSKPSPPHSAINQPVAIRKDLPRLPIREQRQQAKTVPQEKAEEYVRPLAIQSVQPSFDDSAKAAIDRALSQNDEAHEVRVLVKIDERGSVVQASVASTAGPFASLFVDSALAAARRWQFKPASLEGRPVSSSITLRFNFVRKPH